MRSINIKFDEVGAEVAKCRSYISSNIVNRVESEYRQICSNLAQTDGETNAALLEAIEVNRQKTVTCANTLERLLSFMANSSRQIQISDEQISRSFRAIRR